jgi:ABC-2 type transport system permease protein
MISDIITIAQKELKEIFLNRGSVRGGVSSLLIVVGICGIFFPLQWGEDWITQPIGLAMVAWLPLFMSIGLVTDAFAGERERHTLETLLASRLSDQAILFGKMAAASLYGLSIAVGSMLLGAVTVNIAHPGIGFYPVQNFLGAILFAMLLMLLVTGAGVLVSLHASTVRQAYQRMSFGFLALWVPLSLGPQILPEAGKQQLAIWIAGINGLQAAIAGAVLLVIVDGILIALAITRFQRSRLILD